MIAVSAGVGSFIGNVIWFLLAGWWRVIAHLVSAVAPADLELIPISLAPLGEDIVPTGSGEFDR